MSQENTQLQTAESVPVSAETVIQETPTEGATERVAADVEDPTFIDLQKEFLGEDTLALLPRSVIEEQKAVPFAQRKSGIAIALLNPDNTVLKRLLEKKFANAVQFFHTSEEGVQSVLTRYGTDIHKRFGGGARKRSAQAGRGQNPEDNSVIELVDSLLKHGVERGASDIHIEPQMKGTLVRERVDGLLQKAASFTKEVHERLIQRIKVMANLATDEHAMPQDGKLTYWTPEEKRVDVRVSIVPTMHGEKIVLRLLPASQDRDLSLEALGFEKHDKEIIEEQAKMSWGMVLITGPTGSGKSTTLYTIMTKLNSEHVNLSTIEDPVEYDLPGANQIQVNEKTGLTFSSGLRALVRQDPNIILVGEIRDRDTAGIAVNAAMTGHLVLSTLHTNNAATAIPRLVDMGIEPFLIASVVNVVVAQRLVRKICPECIEDVEVQASELESALPPEIFRRLTHGESVLHLKQGKGCERCSGTGFRGRQGIFEVLMVTTGVREKILKKESAEAIQKQALSEGMTTMIDDGIEKVRSGITTIQEILRVIRS